MGRNVNIEDWKEYVVLGANLVTQSMCVSGVNRLSSVRSYYIILFGLISAYL